jgi:threonyl-tRNA synthetase
MPDVHALCQDMKQAMDEFLVRFKLCMEVLKGIGLEKEDYELALRSTKDFFERNKKFIVSLVKLFGKPALLEIWEERFFYFVLKWEFNFIDNLNKAAALSTDQIDIENAERYGITYIDKNGKKKYPIILHCSPSGAIERCIYALLEKAYSEQQKGKVPKLPLWLSPTQVRIIPVSNKFLKEAEKIAKELEENSIRVDIDDREETVSKKIREAEIEWIPIICVVGSKEIKEKMITVRIRERKEIKEMKIEKLIEMIKEEVKGKPFKLLSLPKYLSKRAIFVS